MKIWDRRNKKLLRRFKAEGHPILSAAISPNGKALAVGSYDSTVALWEVPTGKRLRVLTLVSNTIYPWGTPSLAFSSDNRLLAVAVEDGTVQVWDVGGQKPAQWKCISTLLGHFLSVSSVTFSPDNKLLASGGEDSRLIVWNVQSGKPLHTEDADMNHLNPITAVSFSPDGKTLSVATAKGMIHLWNVPAWRRVRNLRGHSDPVDSMAWAADGTVLVSTDGKVKLWQLLWQLK